MPYPSGAVAGWKCNDLVDYVAATHTLIGAGTSPFADNARSGTKSLGSLSGSNYFRNATARTALSGATTWGLSFRFYAPSYSTGPQILSIGNTTGDNIVYRVLSSGAIRAIINDSIFTDSASGIVLADRWMAGGLEFTGGVLKAYAALDSVTNATPALTISNAAGDFPTNGSIWFGVAGTNPTFLPFAGGYIDDVVLFSTAPGSYPQVDTGPAPTVGSATANTLTLTWTDEWALSYDVYRNTSNDSSTATKVGNVAAGVQSFIAAGLSAETEYFFWLRPVYHPQNTGAFGTVGSATTSASSGTLPAQPTGLSATADGASRIDLAWLDGADTEAQVLYRNTADNFAAATPIASIVAGTQAYTDTGREAATEYFYWLLPLSSNGAGTVSAVASATTAAAPSLTLDVADDLAYDLLVWLVATATGPNNEALFTNGELTDEAQVDGTFHALLDFTDEAPADALVVTAAADNETEPGVPVRVARVECLIRAQEDEAIGSARNRAQACAKAIAEHLRDSDQRNKAMQALPSGRVVHAFTEISYTPAGQDVSGRFEYLLEFTVRYMDTLTQTN
jgi:hypothetical protein